MKNPQRIDIAGVKEFPEWIYLHSKPYTKIDDIVYTVEALPRGDEVVYEIYRYDGLAYQVVLKETFDISGDNLQKLKDTWDLVKRSLPSLIMESLL